MLKWKKWICSSLVVAATVAPVLAGTKDAADAKPETPPSAAAQPSANGTTLSPAANANVTALLGLLVMKGVLAPNEANEIRNAAPDAEFRMLVDLLARKGVVSAGDLSAATAAPAPAPAPPQVAQSVPKETKPPGPTVVPAIAPLRVLPVDPPVRDGLKAAFNVGPIKMTPYGF